MSSPAWKSWTRSEWNSRLFRYCFEADGDLTPRERIPALPQDLRRVTGDEAASLEEVQEAFIQAVWVQRWRLENILNTERMPSTSGDVPGYFVYLYLTCYAGAGGADAKVVSAGQFRDRLNVLMGGAKKGYGVPMSLEFLERRWKEFETWLRQVHERRGLRPLKRPTYNASWNRIGYALALAVPTRKDRMALSRALEPLRGFERPPVEAVRGYVGTCIRSCSDELQRMHDRFNQAFRNGAEPHGYPFWEVVLDAVRLEIEGGPNPRERVRLVVDPDRWRGTRRLVVMARDGASTPAGWRTVSIYDAEPPFNATLAPEEGSPYDTARRLLGGTRAAYPQAFSFPLRSIAEQGVLVFCRESDGMYALQTSLPPRGIEAWVLWSTRRNADMRLALGPEYEESEYAGWRWRWVKDTTVLYNQRHLRDVRVLQPTVAPAALRLSGGARTSSGGYMGRAGALPLVSAPSNVLKVRLYKRNGTDTQGAFICDLIGDKGVFVFPIRIELEGEYEIVGSAHEATVARVRVQFERGEYSAQFRQPTALDDYFVEGVDDDAEVAAHEKAWEIPPSPPVRRGRPPVLVMPRKGEEEGTQVVHPVPPRRSAAWSVETFVEVLAARASQRNSVPTSEMIDLAERYLGVPFLWSREREVNGWDVLRSWEEAGVWDVLQRRRHNSRVYAVRPPILRIVEEGGIAHAYVDGLVGETTATRLRVGAESVGLMVRRSEPTMRWTPPRWVVYGGSRSALEALGARLEIPVTDAPPLVCTSAGAGVGMEEGSVLDGPYTEAWDWEKLYFAARPTVLKGPSSVELMRYAPFGAPEYYRVQTGDGVRHFRLRNRALLDAFAASGTALFNVTDAGLACIGSPLVFLPLPLARALVARTGRAPEAVRPEGANRYFYPCSPSDAGRVAAVLEGRLAEGPDAPRRMRGHAPYTPGGVWHRGSGDTPSSGRVSVDEWRRLRALQKRL